MLVGIARCEHENRGRYLGRAQSARHGETVAFGQCHVQEHGVVGPCGGRGFSRRTIGFNVDDMPGFFEATADHSGKIRIVFHDQNSHNVPFARRSDQMVLSHTRVL